MLNKPFEMGLKSIGQKFRVGNGFSFLFSQSNDWDSRKTTFDCKSCSKKTIHPECNACHRMINYFDVFRIPQQYQINEKDITNKAKELQKEYHPDKHSFDSQMESMLKEKMEKYSAYINDAKATLLDDLKRATYLMELQGVDIDESSEIQLGNDFMKDMFLLQEEIEEAGVEDCEQIQKNIQNIMKELQGQFDSFFQEQEIQKCKEFVFKYKYLHRALQNVKNKIHSLKESQQNA